MISEVKKMEYDIRFRTFLRQIMGVSRMKPKERYLYSLMKNIDYGTAKNYNENKG